MKTIIQAAVAAAALCWPLAAAAQSVSLPPTGLDQFESDGTTTIAVGGTATQAPAVVLKGVVSGTFPPTTVYKLQIEVRPTGTPFTGNLTHESAAWYANGALASVDVSGLMMGPTFHWQARTRSS